MARGFESKQVEHQQAEAERRRELRERGRVPDPALAARRRSLELARADVLQRIAAARNDRLVEQLRLTLAAIEKELAASPSA